MAWKIFNTCYFPPFLIFMCHLVLHIYVFPMEAKPRPCSKLSAWYVLDSVNRVHMTSIVIITFIRRWSRNCSLSPSSHSPPLSYKNRTLRLLAGYLDSQNKDYSSHYSL